MNSVARFTSKSLAMLQVDVIKLRRDPTEILSRAIQPALWMLVFGQVMARTRAIHTGNMPYLDFMAPGILAQKRPFHFDLLRTICHLGT